MGTIELQSGELIIYSHIITYGNAADSVVTERIREEIEQMWNEPRAEIVLDDKPWRIVFKITAALQSNITALEIYQNTDPRNNYFRIEEFVYGNISFVDGLGCNSGYFKFENLYAGSTTAAHEYGHSLGLAHPTDMDLRGKGVPGIMYPRGTLVDPPFQYNPGALAGDGQNGGTMHPMYRRVNKHDIEKLRIHKLDFHNGKSVIGEFSSVWHPNHADINSPDYLAGIFAG